MKTGITLSELATEVTRRAAEKVDLLADTTENIRMVPMDDYPNRVALVVLETNGEFNRFSLTEQAHRQIATWTKVPWTYYERLLNDHRDLVIQNVNTLFEREPGTRMVRTLDGKCRAFVSDRYRRLDNDYVLAKSLPAMLDKDGNMPVVKILANHITDDAMRIRAVFTDPGFEQDIGEAPRGKGRDVVNPGFEIGNSETGKGSLFIRGFFHRGYCDNGCIWQFGDDALSYERHHLGGKLKVAEGIRILSDETLRKDDEAIVSALTDVMRALGSHEVVNQLGEALRAAKSDTQLLRPTVAVQVLANDCGLRDGELDAVMRNLMLDGDLSRYGVLNAVTALANSEEVTQERAFHLEEIGGNILTMTPANWLKIATAEKVPVRRAA